MARLIHPDRTEEIVHPRGMKWTLKELQSHVGGYTEFIPFLNMIVNEEGRWRNQLINQIATDIMIEALRGRLKYGPVIVGDVLILDKTEKM